MASPRIGCEKCNFAGFFIVDGEMQVCECIARKRLYAVYEGIGIPRSLYGALIEQYDIKSDGKKDGPSDIDTATSKAKEEARNEVIDYIRQMPGVFRNDEDFRFGGGDSGKPQWGGRTLVLCGGKQSGKSLLITCIAKEALKLSVTPRIFQWADVIEACYDFDHEDDDNDFRTMAHLLARAQPIIIENFSMNYETRKFPTDTKTTGGLNPLVRRRIDSLFSPVYQRGLPTVITTSHGATELNEQDAYGPLMSSFLSDAHKISLPSMQSTGNKKR